MKKKILPQISLLSSDGTVHIAIGNKFYRYYGIDTAIYSSIMSAAIYKPWAALNLIKMKAKRMEKGEVK